MATPPQSSWWASCAQVLGMIVMTLASLYWVAVDYPDWLPASVLALIPQPAIGTVAQWIIIFAGSGIGWGMYQWGTWRKAGSAKSQPRH